MERRSERFMSRYEDNDLAIWVCPEDHEVREFPLEGPEPDRTICSECGKDYVERCPSLGCPSRTYHWSDHGTKFHKCREPIPWSWWHDQRAGEWPEHRSKLRGTRKLSDAEKLIQSMTYRQPAERTPDERKELITPPIEHLPKQEGITWDRLEGMGTTLNHLKTTKLVRDVASSPADVKPVGFARIRRGIGHMGAFTYLVLVAVVAGVILIWFAIWLYNQGWRSL